MVPEPSQNTDPKNHPKMIPKVTEKVSFPKAPTWLNHSKYWCFRACHGLRRDSNKLPKTYPKRPPKYGPNGPQIAKNTIQKTYQKNIKKRYPKWTKTGPQMGSQSRAKIAKNDVLGSPLHKGGSQAASRPPSRSILEVFWDDLRTISGGFSNTFEVYFRCVV